MVQVTGVTRMGWVTSEVIELHLAFSWLNSLIV
jgi:hypothetical protein